MEPAVGWLKLYRSSTNFKSTSMNDEQVKYLVIDLSGRFD